MEKSNESKGLGLASLVCSIFGILLLFMPYFGLPLSILGIVFASMQKKKVPTGIATAGNAVGIVGTVLNTVMFLVVVLVILAALAWA